METINTRFKSVRKALGKNQTEFAKEIGLTQSSITMIERGERDVLERHIKTICSIFHVNEKWLVDGEGTMFTKEKEKTDLVAWAERMAAEGDTFAHRLAVVISRLTPEQLDTLAEIAEKLVGQSKKEAPAAPQKEQPKKVEAAAVAVAIPEKAKTIIAFLKPFGIDCEYLDYEPTFGEPGDFMAMTTVFDKFQGEEGRPHSSSICSRPLEGLYEELKPVMDASGMKRKALIDKFIADTFQRDINIAEGLSSRDESTLLNVSKEVASKYHGVIDEDGNPRLERIKSNEAPTDKKPAKKKAAEG